MPDAPDRLPAGSGAEAQQQYDRWAAVYDRVWRGYVRATTGALLSAADVAPGEAVLDVGCGTGAFAARLLAQRPGQPFTGVDVSAEMLAAAREKTRGARQARFVTGDMHALPFPAGAFDVVVSASALHYAHTPALALAEMRRVVRPGGRVVLVDWCRDFATMQAMDALLRHVDAAHVRTLTLGEVRAQMRTASLVPVRTRRFRHWWWGLMTLEAEAAHDGGGGD